MPLSLLLPILLAPSATAQDIHAMVEMRDGTGLATDVFLPDGDGPWPTILYRTPYGREEFHENGRDLPAYGVVVVTQDMRGRYDSEGADMVFSSDGDGELQDGYDS